jgi:hypothetical protein
MAITAAGKNRIMIFGPKRVSREWKPRLIECHEPRSDRQKQTRLRRARRERVVGHIMKVTSVPEDAPWV